MHAGMGSCHLYPRTGTSPTENFNTANPSLPNRCVAVGWVKTSSGEFVTHHCTIVLPMIDQVFLRVVCGRWWEALAALKLAAFPPYVFLTSLWEGVVSRRLFTASP